MNRSWLGRGRLDLSHWGCEINSTGHMELDGCDLVAIARKYGTPTHVVSKKRLVENCERAKAALGASLDEAEVFYSYKTNCVPGILDIIHKQGVGAEVISPYELWVALKLGLPGEKIIFNGPHKTRESLQLAVRHRVKLINVDSITDIRKLVEVCRAQQMEANLGVRLCPTQGWSAQFGLNMKSSEAVEGFRLIEKNRNLVKLKGLHVHLGSQITDKSLHPKAVAEVVDFLQQTGACSEADIQYLDVGGGFGVPTVREVGGIERKLLRLLQWPFRPPRPQRCPDIGEYATTLKQAFERYASNFNGGQPKAIVEPGRAITSNTQVLLLGVCAIKDRTPPAVILDGGKMNITYPTSFEYHQVLVANKMRDSTQHAYKLVGRTCTPSDLVYDNVRLPSLAEGDVIALMDAGAYFTSFSNDFAFPRPSIVLLDDGQARLIRERESFEGMVARDQLDWPTRKQQVVA